MDSEINYALEIIVNNNQGCVHITELTIYPIEVIKNF
jgi:hypothetical protein